MTIFPDELIIYASQLRSGIESGEKRLFPEQETLKFTLVPLFG